MTDMASSIIARAGLVSAALVALLAGGAALGAALEELSVRGENGDIAPLTERMETPGLLHLWATWCAPCLRELPELAAFKADRPALGEGVVLLSVDTAPYARVTSFLTERLGLEGLSSLQVVEGNAGAALGVTGYPATVFVSAEGDVIDVHQGMLNWSDPALRERIAELLAGD